ncbi:MAG: hypothetical protein D6727_05470 [Gammaproteobacteria bacterium]|nr:MAG: hypothetical protein D6727_05470 [Gammaproteobacteria bacterium]
MPRNTAQLLLLLFAIHAATAIANDGKGEQAAPADPAYLSTPLPLARLHEAASSHHVLARIDAVRELSARADQRSRLVLQQCLADAEPMVRRLAALGLGRIGNGADAAVLARALADSEPGVRHAAGSSLLKLRPLDSAGAILAELRHRDCRLQAGARPGDARAAMQDWGQSPLVVAKKVLQSLAGDDADVRRLLKKALNSRKRCVRYAAAYALSGSSRPRIARALDRAAARRDVAVVAGAYPRFISSDDPALRRALRIGGLRFDDPDLALALRDSGDAEFQAVAARVLAIKGIDIQEVIAP